MYGFYSKKAVEMGCPTVWYLHADGSEIEVCQVSQTEEEGHKSFVWPDAVCVGELTQYLRAGRKRGI